MSLGQELVNNILFDTEKEEQRQAALDDYGDCCVTLPW